MQKHSHKHSELRDIVLQLFITNMPKKIIGSFLEMLPGIIFSGGTTEVYIKPLNVAEKTIHNYQTNAILK